MNARIFLLLFTHLSLFSSSFSTVLLVDNSSNAATNAYSTVQAAHNAAVSGDTIYVIGTGSSYGQLTATKTLYWFGPGYLLQNNPETQANPGSARLSGVSFNSGSAGSSMTGFCIEGTLDFVTGNILFRRNYVSLTNNTAFMVEVLAPNVILEQCYFYHPYTSGSGQFISIGSAANNTVFRNCILYSYANEIIGSTLTGALTFRNCVFDLSTMSFYNAVLVNCILKSGSYSANNNEVTYSMCNSTQFGSNNHNIQNVDMAFVFQTTEDFDAYYQLASGSPAIGTGESGSDMGVFGGLYPYILSGIPNLPTITYINAPSTGSTVNGLPITIRVRGRN